MADHRGLSHRAFCVTADSKRMSRRAFEVSIQGPVKVAPAEGRLGVLIPGMGAVATTFIAGVAPNLTTDVPALLELARQNEVAICGKDFKTGQTYMKTLLAPGFKALMLGVRGWFSTNILGNRDGEVLEDPGSFKTKEETKLSVLEQILQPDLYPQLYKDLYHAVRINYYPPRAVIRKRDGTT